MRCLQFLALSRWVLDGLNLPEVLLSQISWYVDPLVDDLGLPSLLRWILSDYGMHLRLLLHNRSTVAFAAFIDAGAAFESHIQDLYYQVLVFTLGFFPWLPGLQITRASAWEIFISSNHS
jgi:hypothetical protein